MFKFRNAIALAASTLIAGWSLPASAGPVQTCVSQGGDWVQCACASGGPCEGAVFTVDCGQACDTLGTWDVQADPNAAPLSIDFYDSRGTLLYTDDAVYPVAKGSGTHNGLVVIATGNNDAVQFDSIYRGANTSILRNGDLVLHYFRVTNGGVRTAIATGANMSSNRALWSEHSVDGLAAQSSANAAQAAADAASAAVTAEMTRAKAAEAAAVAAAAVASAQLGADVSAEVARATAAENAMAVSLTIEQGRALSAEAGLSMSLSAESSRAVAAEVSLSGQIVTESLARAQADADTLAAAKVITDRETGRSQAAEAALDAAITAESTRAKAAEATLSTGLSSESARAAAAEANLAASVSNEVSRAQAAEAALTGSVSNAQNNVTAAIAAETARAKAAEAMLSASVSSEGARATAAEAALIGLLNNAITDRAVGDASLQNAINNESAARQAADAQLLATVQAAISAQSASDRAYTDQRTPWPASCPNGQVPMSTGGGAWTCGSGSLPQCPAGQLLISTGGGNWKCANICGSQITDVATDAQNCGQCGNVCNLPNAGQGCNNGSCFINGCNGGFSDCNGQPSDGCEANTNYDNNNCGGCGNVCQGGLVCSNGQCQNGIQVYVEGPGWISTPCGPGDYECEAFQICQIITGFQCVRQDYDCAYGYMGSYYPLDGQSGSSNFNFAFAYDFAGGGDYGNICACDVNQMYRYGLATNHQNCGWGHWQRN